MKMGIFNSKHEHKVKGQHRMTFMIITDATKDPVSIGIPKWIRFPILILSVALILGAFSLYEYVVRLETEIVEGKLSVQTAIIEKEDTERKVASLNEELEYVEEQRFSELLASQNATETLLSRIEQLEEYTNTVTEYKEEIDTNLSLDENQQEIKADDSLGNNDIGSEEEDSDIPEDMFSGRLMVDPNVRMPGLSTSSANVMTSMLSANIVDPELTSDTVNYVKEIQELNQYLNFAVKEIDTVEENLLQTSEALEEMIPYVEAYPSIFPVENAKVTSPFGYRRNPFGGYSKEFHKGIDLKANYIPVMATGGGVVVEAKYLSGYGYTVIIDHGYGLMTRYAHNSELYVSVGDEVKRGDIISKSGNSGRSTGPHLHYEVILDGEVTDPLEYIYEEKTNEGQ